MGPWFSMPWWKKWGLFAFWRTVAYFSFAYQMARWLLLDGSYARSWIGQDGRLAHRDSERLYVETTWAWAIGKADINMGAWVDIDVVVR